jgi:hypothetical protein
LTDYLKSTSSKYTIEEIQKDWESLFNPVQIPPKSQQEQPEVEPCFQQEEPEVESIRVCDEKSIE